MFLETIGQALRAAMVLAGLLLMLDTIHPFVTGEARVALTCYVTLFSVGLAWNRRPRPGALPAPAYPYPPAYPR